MTAGTDVSTVNKVLALQAWVLIGTVTVFFLAGGLNSAMSPGLGGLVALLGNLFFAYWIKLSSGKSAKQMLQYFYIAEAAKIFLTVFLFIIFFQIPGVKLPTLLIGYATVLSVHWFALILWRNI